MESKWTHANRHNVDAHTHTRERGADAFCGVRAASRPWHPPCAILREACRHELAKHRVHCVDTMCIRYEYAKRCGCVCVSALRICICTLYFSGSPRSRKSECSPDASKHNIKYIRIPANTYYIRYVQTLTMRTRSLMKSHHRSTPRSRHACRHRPGSNPSTWRPHG